MKTNLLPVKGKGKLQVVFYLMGDGNVGKSETLLALARAFMPKCLYYYEQKGQYESHDKRIVFKYKGRLIGIGTAGDDEDQINANFDFFEMQHCSLAITASRPSLVRHVKAKAASAKVFGIKKTDVSDKYSQAIVKSAVVNRFVSALKKSGIKDVVNEFKKGGVL